CAGAAERRSSGEGPRLPVLFTHRWDREQRAVPHEENAMIITRRALPRRTVLRGAGATLVLPLLDAMIAPMTALADTPASPARLRRLGLVFMPMGSDISRWAPPGAARPGYPRSGWRLSPTLTPLEHVKQQVTVIS